MGTSLFFSAVKNFYNEFKHLPDQAQLKEYAERELKRTNQTDEITLNVAYKLLRQAFKKIKRVGLEKKTIVDYIKRKRFLLSLEELDLENVKGTDYNKLIRVLTELQKLDTPGEVRKGEFLVQDYKADWWDDFKIVPTGLKGLNRMTAAGGFYSPQLVVFLGPPKSFKTGLLLFLALCFIKDGYNVYYADYENGLQSIKNRLQQLILDCTFTELRKKKYEKQLASIVKQLDKLAGDIFIQSFKGKADSVQDIENDLDYLLEFRKWKPDVIIWDYADITACEDKSVQQERLKIQYNYHRMISLNKKFGCFTMTVSKVTKKAFKKFKLEIDDFGEDSAKAYNAHAAFSLNQTQEEYNIGDILRICPLLQREGVDYKSGIFCTVQLDRERMQVKEVDYNDFDFPNLEDD